MILVRSERSRSPLVVVGVALLGIFAIGGLSGGLYVVAAMAVGTAAGVALLLAYRYLRRVLS
jgi:uncharacterized membrane protein (DUF4010 family)